MLYYAAIITFSSIAETHAGIYDKLATYRSPVTVLLGCDDGIQGRANNFRDSFLISRRAIWQRCYWGC
jgi:hypothetical protein